MMSATPGSNCGSHRRIRHAGWKKWPALLGTTVAMLCACHASVATISPTPTTWPGGRWTPDDAQYGMAVVKKIPITMSDGATLYADVGYPTDKTTGQRVAGTFPVLLAQDPYDVPLTNNSVFTPNKFMVSRGYIYAVAQVRGTGGTKGPNNSRIPNELFSARQGQDGAELAEWAAHKLDGSNGIVGLTGCSFLGEAQIFTAAAAGPNSPIKAMVPSCIGIGYEVFFPGGIEAPIDPLFGISPAMSLFGRRNLKENASYFKTLSENYSQGGTEAYNGDFWQVRNTSNAGPQVVHNGIPTLLWSGWKALEINYALALYSIFQNTAAGRPPYGPMATDQPATGRYQIIVEPGFHGEGLDETLILEWFDTWLKGQDTGIDKTTTPLHLYENQSKRWVNAAHVPFVDAYTPFYIGAGRSLTTTAPSAGQDAVQWALPSENSSTLTYTSAPLQQSRTIAGPIAATVWASSTNTNMELIATLYDVDSRGTAKRISYGALIGSMKALNDSSSWLDTNGLMVLPDHPFTNDVYLTPNTVERFDIKLHQTVWALQAGHSLRLVISTQGDPNKECKLTGLVMGPSFACLNTAPQKNTLPGGVYTVQRGGSMATMINLPLLDPASLPTARSSTDDTSRYQTQPMDWGPASN
jgi:predicted acyl esterase